MDRRPGERRWNTRALGPRGLPEVGGAGGAGAGRCARSVGQPHPMDPEPESASVEVPAGRVLRCGVAGPGGGGWGGGAVAVG